VLDAARAGDRDALEILVTTHYDRVHALCRRMLGNDADALDATQDTLVAALRALSRFDGRSSFGTWIYRIATNTCLDEIRRRRRRPVVGIATDIGAGSAGESGVRDLRSTTAHAGTGDSRDPGDVVTARVDIDAALASIPIEFRTAVVLRDVCDLPYDEIAEILGVPVGTVRSRIARARSALAATWHTEIAELPQPAEQAERAERAGAAGRGRPGVTGNDSIRADVRTKGPDQTSGADGTVNSQKDERTQ
jgi:RNA polymerase sigma-70 factor (ECF subfamily)